MMHGKMRIALACELLKDLDKKVVRDNESWARLRSAFGSCISQFGNGAYLASEYIGGQSVNRDFKGTDKARDPITPISGAKQREALSMLVEHILSDKAFHFSPALLRKLITESRVKSTRVVGEAIGHASNPPRVWLQASTATIYSHRYDEPNEEATGVIGGSEPHAPDTWNFSIDVVTSWERALNEALTPHTRKVLLRSAIVMSPDRGGAFDMLLTLARFGLGGRAGDGRQYVSWIHDQDFIGAFSG